jgi:2-methylcitrate dehydratase
MIAIPLIFGRLTAADYEDKVAADPVFGPRIDALRDKVSCIEEPQFTRDYHDPEKRSIPNSLRVELADGTVLEETVEYPIGHKRRRTEGMPLLVEKFKRNLARRFSDGQQQRILAASLDRGHLDQMTVSDYVDLYAVGPAGDSRSVFDKHALCQGTTSVVPQGRKMGERFSP